MTVQSIEDVVVACMARACNLERELVQAQTDVIALGMDSLSLVGVVNSVCGTFGVDVDEAALEQLFMAQTVGEFTALLEELLTPT